MSAQTEPEPAGYRTTTEEVLSRDDIDIRGKTFLITGGTAGLGEESIRVLAKHGAKVIFSARDLAAAEKVVEKTKAEISTAEITYYQLDLSSLASVKAFADQVKASGVQLNGLILNAGVMAPPFGLTVDGFETQFVNAPARVVVVSSLAHFYGGIDFSDPNFSTRPYDKWKAYGQSKTANILFAYHLNKLYASKGVEAFSLHPGGIRTALQRHVAVGEVVREGWIDAEGNFGPLWKTVPQGAATQVWALSAPELNGKGGAYLEDVSVSSPQTEQAKDPNAAERLWSVTEEYVKKYL